MSKMINRKIIVSVMFTLGVLSCNTGTFELGQEFVKSATYTELIDTVSIDISTFRLDSVQTSGSGVALVGDVAIPGVGTLHSQSYFKVVMSSGMGWNNKEHYDSVCISLKHGSTFMGDTLKPFSLVVNRVTQTISGNDNGAIFNNRVTEYDDKPLGSYRYFPRPVGEPKISFRLNDDFGREIMAFCKDNYQNSDNASFFADFLKGIRLGSGDGNQSLMSFAAQDSNMVITVYSHLPAIESEIVTREITLSNSTLQYNLTNIDGLNHSFGSLSGYKDLIPSKKSDDLALMHESSGFYCRVDFPYINELQDANQKGYVIKAELLLYPAKGSYDIKKIPSQIYLHEIKKVNEWGSVLYGSDESQVTGTLYADPFLGDNVYYKADVTQYINYRLKETIVNTDNGITFTWGSSQNSNSLDALLIDCPANKSKKTALKLYYYYYDKD